MIYKKRGYIFDMLFLYIKILIFVLSLTAGLLILSPGEIIAYTLLALFLFYIFGKNKEEKNLYYSKLFLKSKVLYRNKYIRVSITYLFRIKVKDKYLLINGRENKNQYQPVGGVIKWLPAARKELDRLEVKDDKKVPIRDSGINDLKIRVKGKYLHDFLKWFDSGEARENNAYRKVQEQLVEPGVLSQENFKNINYRCIKRVQTGIKFSKHFQCPELKIVAVYELIPSDEQKKELKQLIDKESNRYIWLSEDEIINYFDEIQFV